MTLNTLLSERADREPDSVSIKFEDRKVSYSEANRLVDLCAGGLSSIGVKPCERVAILMHNCPEYIIAYFSIIRTGAIAVPINTFLIAGEISYILSDAGCKILIYDESFSYCIDDIKKNITGLNALIFDDIPQLHSNSHNGSDNDTAVLLYTSGTTGFPKGAMLTHRNLITNVEACSKVMELSRRDRILLFLPLFHSFTFTVCVLLPIYTGATIVLLKSVKPFSKVIRSILMDRITFFVAVPTIYNILSRKRMSFILRCLFRVFVNIRVFVSGASALPEKTIHEFEKKFKVPLIEGYGLTEASPVVAVNPLHGVRKPASVGPPVAGVEVAIVGDDGKRMSVGETGELIVKGGNVMKGYFNKEKETREVLKDEWLYTGDMARIDDDGYIFIVDRKKDLIIVDGMNIYPRQVEDILLQHESVEECAMVGIPDGRGSEITTLFIKKKEGVNVDEGDMRNYLKDRVARYKIPRRIIIIDEFPKTATGKIKKAELRNWKS